MTAKDIAQKLNISPSAVSLALNGRKGVSEETREKVLALAKEYGIKKGNRSQIPLTNTIALVIFRRYNWICNDNVFFASLIESIGTACRKANYILQIMYFLENDDWDRQIDTIAASGCSGVILLATEMFEHEYAPFHRLQLPVVVLDNAFDESSFSSITINNLQGAALAVNYAIEMGHRSIGFLKNAANIRNFQERHDGAQRAIRLFNQRFPSDPVSVIPVDVLFDSISEIYSDMRKYLQKNPEMPSVYIADNDTIAIPCIQALQDHGFRVPDDISVIGFDNASMTNLINMDLTTIEVPRLLLGHEATRLLISFIEGDDPRSVRICVNTTLIRRSTVKRISAV